MRKRHRGEWVLTSPTNQKASRKAAPLRSFRTFKRRGDEACRSFGGSLSSNDGW